MSRPLIALDADGVLLDYNAAYAQAWARAFGSQPELRDAEAYWAIDRWDVERLEGERLEVFRRCFDKEFWSTVPAIDGAIEACRALVDSGFELVCVSALDAQFSKARQANLLALGFPIQRVTVTGNHVGRRSPKANAIETLQPAAFVDDYLPYHYGIGGATHKALVMREQQGSPNIGPELS